MQRRQLLLSVWAAGLVSRPASGAQARRAIAPMTEGPFYPPISWRERWPDQDADLSRIGTGTQARVARGEHLGVAFDVVDTAGRSIDRAEIEIWQCDALQAYRHPGVGRAAGHHDDAFQGFGMARSDGAGHARFRTIRPVPYPGRTPHIHVKLRHASFGEVTSQLFVAGDPGNARDFLWRSLARDDRAALEMQLRPADAGSGLRWMARHALVVPA